MNTPFTPKQDVFRDVLIRMLNIGQPRGWDELVAFAPSYHVDLEDEEMFHIHINEQIMHAAQKLKDKGARWTHDFEALAKLLEPEIAELP